MRLVNLEDLGHDVWDSVVDEFAESTIFHQAHWADILKKGLGVKPYYLAAEQDGAICGILPMAQIRRPFAYDFVSLPMATLCGCLALDVETRTCQKPLHFLFFRKSEVAVTARPSGF